jgi:hypothetical protein
MDARFPPAEEPPVAILEMSICRADAPSETSQSRASQQSWTAAGNGVSGASLDR